MVVDLYATWCESCVRQLPALAALAEAHRGELVVVGIDVGEELEVAATFATQQRIEYATFGDPEFAFADCLGIAQLPTLLVIDSSGAIIYRSRELDDQVLEVVDSLLSPP